MIDPTHNHVYLSFNDEEALTTVPQKSYRGAFVTRSEIAPHIQLQCVKCSLLGLSLLSIGIFDLTISLSKGSFWNRNTPEASIPFISETADYVVFSSGLLAFVSAGAAFRSGMLADGPICIAKVLAVTAIATSMIGLSVSDYFS
jgi:hypothetical protein